MAPSPTKLLPGGFYRLGIYANGKNVYREVVSGALFTIGVFGLRKYLGDAR